MKKKAAKAPKKTAKADHVSVYILLDRSSSMAKRWEETLGAINAYVAALDGSAEVTIATFSKVIDFGFEVVRDAVSPDKYEPVTRSQIQPGGFTPLYDAIGRAVSMAEKNAAAKTVFIVMTDGEENASKEVTRSGAEKMFKDAKARGWQVVFMGVDFDAYGQSASVGISMESTINTSAGNYGSTVSAIAEKTVNYGVRGQSMSFSAEDKATAMGQVKKP